MGILEPGETLRPVFMYTSPAMTLLNAPKSLYNQYPRQFWLMIAGVVIATAGGSMIWPFMFIYAIGAGSVALAGNFWGFWLSMVILTFGELTLVPTASKYVADISPANLRGRYMSIHWLGWGLARTLAPLIGGFLNDSIAPRAIWIGGLLIGLTSTFGLFLLSRLTSARTAPQTQPSARFPTKKPVPPDRLSLF